MFGLIVFGLMGLYLVISMFVVSVVAKRTKQTKARIWGPMLAAFVMYNLVFWDWLPTVAVHQYYCSTEAGFWVYKTLDQWKAENPGVMEGLVANKGAPSTRQGKKGGFTDTYFLNQRINQIVKEYRVSSILPIYRLEQEVVDASNDRVLARYVDFWTGYVDGWGDIKSWMTSNKHCGDNGTHRDVQFYEFENQLTGSKKTASGMKLPK